MQRDEFNAWFTDFGRRFPAVSEYLNKRAKEDQPVLLDTWRESLAAFDANTMAGVTYAIIHGDLPPVPNVDLGQFGEVMRQRAKEWRMRQPRNKPEPEAVPFSPLKSGSMVHGLRCLKAAAAILRERGQDDEIDARVTPWHWSGAAIILADDHTAAEAKDAGDTLRAAGLAWPDVCKRAAEMDDSIFLKLED